MKCIFQKLLICIAVFAVLLLTNNQYAEGIIGDSGKERPTGMIGDTGKPSPHLKQFLLQDISKIKEEIKMTEAKLNKANEGDDLFVYTVTKKSIPNLRNQINELSRKITQAGRSKYNDKKLNMLSIDVENVISILNILEQKAKENMKAGSLELLQKLSSAVIVLQNDINKLGPQPEPPD